MIKAYYFARYCAALLFISIYFVGPICAGQPKSIGDPELVATQLTDALKDSQLEKAASDIVVYTGASEQLANLTAALGFLNGRTAIFRDKVIDQSFGTSLRQIVFFLPYRDSTFVYARYNFKRIDTGWILTNFNFRTEAQEILPAGFVAGY